MIPIPWSDMTPRVAIEITIRKGLDRRSYLHGLHAGLLLRAKGSPEAFLIICNHKPLDQYAVAYETADDVPLTDVPCPCGAAKCFAIKWRETDPL